MKELKKKVDIKNIKDPSFLTNLNYYELEQLSNDIRNEIINVTSKNGGHLSSNLGVVDLVISLHRNFDFKKDKLLFDVGHQCYAHKILTGRNLSTLRTKNGISGFIKNKESPYDIFEAGHSSTSLSAAMAYAIDRDNQKKNYEVVALIGDASIANGVAFEALNQIPSSDHKVIVVLNDNGMAISQPVGAMSKFFRHFQTSKTYDRFKNKFMRPLLFTKPLFNFAYAIKTKIKSMLITTNLFDSLGFVYIGVVNGHDYEAMDKAFKRAKKINKSVIIHIRTKKGKGYSYAENDEIGAWHGVSPFDIKSGKALKKKINEISWSNLYSNFILERLRTDKKFYLICPGTLEGSSLTSALKKYPDRVIDTGISEEHALILASNLAKLGYHVCVSIYSTFMQRGFDQISHDIARIHSPLTVLVDRSGMVGNDGETHQGIYDTSFLMATPNINVKMATNIDEAYQIFNDSFKSKEATFIRYPRDVIAHSKINKSIKVHDYKVIKKGSNKLALVSVGPLTNELVKETKNLKISIYNPITLKPINHNLINELIKYQDIVIYTPYETANGFAGSLVNELVNKNYKGKIHLKTVPLEFVEQASSDEQLMDNGLSIKQICNFVKSLL